MNRAVPLVGAAVALTLAACGPVQLEDPRPTGEVAAQCDALLGDLPDKVLDAARRDTEPGRYTAAWGNPAITLSCGVSQPAAAVTDTRCFEVNKVGWTAEEGQGGWIYTTIGRTGYVQVAVPEDYRPEANALVAMADPIKKHLPEKKPCL